MEDPTEPSDRAKRLRDAASRRLSGVRLILDHLEDRGNRAAILRTAEALGLLYIDEFGVVNPERGRARGVAHGGEKWLIVKQYHSAAECRAACSGHRILAALPPRDQIVSESWHSAHGKRTRRHTEASAAESHAADTKQSSAAILRRRTELIPLPLEKIDFSQPVALCFGNERLGVSDEMLSQCDGAFYIPMYATHYSQSCACCKLSSSCRKLCSSCRLLLQVRIDRISECQCRSEHRYPSQPNRTHGSPSARQIIKRF